jgi:hypothetical protein
LAPIAEMGEKLRRPILWEFLHKVCISQYLSKKQMHISNDKYLEEIQQY